MNFYAFHSAYAIRLPYFKDLSISYFQTIRNGDILVYFDDIVILAKDVLETLRKLEAIVKRAKEYGLNISWKKCQIL